MRGLIMTGLSVVMSAMTAMGSVICSGESEPIRVDSLVSTVNGTQLIYVEPLWHDVDWVDVSIDGTCLFSKTNDAITSWVWQPQTLGNHTLTYMSGTNIFTKTLKVTVLDFFVQPAPNPPMAKDSKISITPTTRDFAVGGGGGAIVVSGSGTWTAAVSDPWLMLNATSGSAGYPVAYTVSANTNVETRVGYVYVSGYTHTVTQEGIGADVDKTNITVEHQGGNGTVNVTAQNRIVWQARPNIDWISVSPTSGAGEGSVNYQVAPFNEVSTRQGTMTIAGNTVTVFQYGRRMKLESYSEKRDWYAHVIPVTVNALAITEWGVTPNASWISIVDAGNGKGGDLVSIAISENPSYKVRTGTVTIGTETFTITQEGRTDLEFSVSPAQSTASVEGAYGLIAVTATPDLPWTAKSGANWVTVVSTTASGAGNGNIVYSASPNSTLYDRIGTVTVTPEAASGMIAKTHTVTQPAAVSALSLSGYEFEAAGESCAVEVSVADIVEWKVEESLDWLTVNGSTSRTGPGTVTLQAAANETVYPRSGTVTIARKTFTVTQKARGVEVEYDTKLFGTDGGMESISIHPDGNVAWTTVASDPTWITIFQGDSGTGDGEIMYIVSPYVGDGTPRTGTITVGDKVIYITQRAYDLSISPNGKKVTGNNGAGEFGVSASIGDVWNAIVTEPWITIVDGYDAGTGSGTVRFIYTENNTGKTRTGKIIVAGEVYTLEQAARTMVSITATAGRGGKVSGGGSYDLGSSVTLTAVPDDGYKFSYWTGDLDSMQNPITVTADVAKSLTAVFEPLPIALESVTSGTDGVRLSWNNLAWATEYRIYRGVTSVPSSATVLAEIVNTGNCTYLDESGVVGTTYWYWIEAEGAEDSVMSDPMTGIKQKIVISPIVYTNLRGATHANPEMYQEGTLVSFSSPSDITGYTFAGWMPSQITTDMTGAQTVNASWTANSYSISYNANGGSGIMDATSATYDAEAIVSANGFTYAGHVFKGWATEVDGEVVYAAGQPVTNLTAQSSGVVMLYAVWDELVLKYEFGEYGSSALRTDLECFKGPGIYTITYKVENLSDYKHVWDGHISFNLEDTADCEACSFGDPNSFRYMYDYEYPGMDFTMGEWLTKTIVMACLNAQDHPHFEIYFNVYWDSCDCVTPERDYCNGSCGDPANPEFKCVCEPPAPCISSDLRNCLYIKDISWKPLKKSSISYENVQGATHDNPESYWEGTIVPFENPSEVEGYTFAGWTPSQITADMTGPQTVNATWTANSYSICYNANGGDGTMEQTLATYDAEVVIPDNGFSYDGYLFKGWATNPDGEAVYIAGQSVTNLTAQAGGVVQLYAVWESEKVENPVITPGDGSIFKSDKCIVTITCATPDAIIYYSTGRTPSENDRYRYNGPFTIFETTTVTAFAVKNGLKSDYVDATITYVEPEVLTLENVLDASNLLSVETGGESQWLPIENSSSKVGASFAVSGEVVDDDEEEHESWLKIKVKGKGTLSFWWRVNCEPDPRGKFTYDRGIMTIDGKQVDRKDGITDWISYSAVFDTEGEHEIVWTYVSDGWLPEDEGYSSCMWVDGVTWTPVPSVDITVDIGNGKSVVVPVEWIDSHADIVAAASGDKAAALQRTAANGRKVWECFMLGIDPTDATAKFVTKIEMVNGKPVITWEPDMNEGSGKTGVRTYKLLGSTDLKTWTEVADEAEANFNFFKVEVSMP